MKELSIFIDESGDFGKIRGEGDYYLVTFVYHDQSQSIYQDTVKLEESIELSGFDIEYQLMQKLFQGLILPET